VDAGSIPAASITESNSNAKGRSALAVSSALPPPLRSILGGDEE